MKEDHLYTQYRLAVDKQYEAIFSHFYFAENRSEATIVKTLVPSYQVILIFNFGAKAFLCSPQGAKVEVDRCLVIGPVKKAFDYALPATPQILVANFKDDAFYRFFGTAAIAEHLPINPDELLNENCFTLLWNELNAIPDINDRVKHILKFCDPYLQRRDSIAEQLANFKEQTQNPIKSIASQNSLSERNIQLHHKKHFGYSAKEINRYQRFLKAVKLLQDEAVKGSKVDWFEVIETCGYYDQSQLIHDFKHFINLNPARYLKFQQDICNPRS